jgi:hypothetical protein
MEQSSGQSTMDGRRRMSPEVSHYSKKSSISSLSEQQQQSMERFLNCTSNYSAVADNPFFGGEEENSEFELMHIRITVYGLTGIVVEKKKHQSKKARNKKKNKDASTTNTYSTGSSITSCEDLRTESCENTPPIQAVVTHNRNVSNSATSISSHLPSLPLVSSTSTSGSARRLNAHWPALHASPLLDSDDDSLIDQSSFIMERVMMKEAFSRRKTPTQVSNFVHETVDLTMNLKQGNELIPLGVATLVISGDEEGPVHMTLPAKPVRFKGKTVVVEGIAPTVNSDSKSSKGKRRPLFGKSKQKPCFAHDKSQTYTLDENATLKIAVQVIPHATLRETAADRARQEHLERRRHKKEESYLADAEREVLASLRNLNTQSRSSIVKSIRDLASQNMKHANQNPFSKLLCSPVCFEGGGGIFRDHANMASSPAHASIGNSRMASSFASSVADDTANKPYLNREAGMSYESSILSSVSESESESESDDEDEQPAAFVDQDIVVRKRK